MTPIKFTPESWAELHHEGYRLVKIPSHLFPDKGWMDVLGYVGQAIDEPSVPVIQLPNGQVRKCYCLYIVPPHPPSPRELETVNKLYLELSQFATAKTKNDLELEKVQERSARRGKLLADIFNCDAGMELPVEIKQRIDAELMGHNA